MSEIIDAKQRALLILQLDAQGYKEKQICMITQAKQPYVSKVRNRKMYADLECCEVELTPRQQARKDALDKIINMPEFITNDYAMVIQVMRFFLVPKEEVYEKFFYVSQKQFGRIWSMKDVDIRMFDSEKIGVSKYDFLDLIIDYFLDKEKEKEEQL